MLKLLLLLALTSLTTNAAENLPESVRPITLIFGGNGFVGSEVTQWLAKLGHKIYSMSRGRWYYDTETVVNPYQTHINCERDDGIIRCDELELLIKNTTKFDYVIDFSAFAVEDMDFTMDAFRGVENKVGVYIYISTDSIYEVCDPKFTIPPIKEAGAIRPTDADIRKEYRKDDQYGDEKLAVEELIKHQYENGGFKYIFFRLPDVIGPRDTSYRFWSYQLWLKYYKHVHVPIFTPKYLKTFESSFVYVKDVAQAIVKAIEIGEPVWNDVYNLAFENGIRQKELIDQIAVELDTKFVRFETRDHKYVAFYPSVTRGKLDITKAKTKLGFKPTDWKVAVKETVAFNERAFFEIPKERENLIRIFLKQIVLPNNRKHFTEEMKKIVDEHKIAATSADQEAHTSRTDL